MKYGKFAAAFGVALCASAAPLYAQSSLPWMNTSLPPEQRAALLVAAMALSDKYDQMHGASGTVVPEVGCTGVRHVAGLPALQIPTFRITNGPVGVGESDCEPYPAATAFPAALAIAASFDATVAASFGSTMATEAKDLGLQLIEAPGMDTVRDPRAGRTFEYFGEDPFLSGKMAITEIAAIQQQGVLAMAKHYVANDQEVNRTTINEIIDDRTLHEIDLIPFEMSVKDGQVASIMCSYNSVNGAHMCQNTPLLTTVLRDQWGFSGFVQSDFGAVYNTLALVSGTNLEMPSGVYFTAANLVKYLASGQITQDMIDTSLRLRYTQMFRLGVFDRPITITPIDATADGKLARNMGEQSAVLLRNTNNALPLDRTKIHTIALIGQAPYATTSVAGGGSSHVTPLYTVLPLQGMQNVLQSLGSSASVSLTTVANDNSNLAVAVAAAQSADTVIVMAGAITSEGSDRTGIPLPNNQDAMISAIAAANPNAIVVLKDGDAVPMPWLSQVPAVLEAWFPGQEDGNIVADLLFGVANPSGKSPVSYPQTATQIATNTPQQYPGVIVNGVHTITYSEALEVGYRWYDANNQQPLFPFGFGLSYTTFNISNVSVSSTTVTDTTPFTVQATVTNTGQRAGAEVVQVYLGLPPSSGEPPRRLVGFQKVFLNPGQSQNVTITIDPKASNHPLSVWDTGSQSWVSVGGTNQVYVGNSSRNFTSVTTITVQHAFGRNR